MTLMQDKSDPTGVIDTSERGSSAGVRARERKAHAALELKKAGESWDTIAEVLGFPTARAALVAVEKTLESGIMSPESQEFMRRLAGSRLEEWLFALRDKTRDGEHPDQLAAIAKSREVLETHMKLFGYAAPAEVAIYNPLESEVTEFVAAITRAKEGGKKLIESDIFETEADEEGVYRVTSEKQPEPEPEPVVEAPRARTVAEELADF